MALQKISEMTALGRAIQSTDLYETSISDGMGGFLTRKASGSDIFAGVVAEIGPLQFEGLWNASTNSPTLASGVGTKGFVYIVNVAGTTNLDGITSWNVGDWAVFNGTAWQKLTGVSAVTNAGSSTDNAVARFDGTTGKVIQNSLLIIDDSGNVSGALSVSVSGVAPTLNFNGTTSNIINVLAGVSGSTGTVASPLTITMGAGGNSTGSNTGAAGAALTITGSNGGNSGTGTPGSGGNITITAGAAGSSTTGGASIGGALILRGGAGATITSGATTASSGQSASLRGGAGGDQLGTGKAGNGGPTTIQGGLPGTPTNGNGGNSGSITIAPGVAGAATSANGTGGNAGTITIGAGSTGGAGTGSGAGGSGAAISIVSGFGGDGGTTGNGGAPGAVNITGGNGGAAPGATAGAGANIVLTSGNGGAGSVAGANGNIRFITKDTSVDFRSNGSAVTEARYYNAGSTQFVGFKAGTLAGSTSFIWPTANVTNGLLTTNGSNQWAFTLTPAGLTSLGVGNLSLSSSTITTVTSSLGLASVDGRVIFSPSGASNPGVALFFNNAGHYASLSVNNSAATDIAYELPATHITNAVLRNIGTGTLEESLLTPGTGIAISYATGSIGIAVTGGGLNFVNQTTSSVTMVANTTYFINNGASLVTLTLPATFAVGDVFRVIGFSSGGWKIAQNSSQLIQFGNRTTTTGSSGFLASTAQSDGIELVALIANTTLANCVGTQGNIDVI